MTGAPRIGVLALQGDVREHARALQQAGADPVEVGDAAGLASVAGLVVPGGESTTMSKIAVRDGLLGPLREARARGLPMYGSCAGMIMLADRVLDARPDQEFVGGLDITVRRTAFGRQVDSFEAEIPWPEDDGGSGPGPLTAVFIRAPWVEAVGPGVEVLGRLAGHGAPDTIVAVRQGPLLATAFHPELTGDLRVHALFVRMVRQAS
ncbi:MAG: pyridoxal 5'-phosphate synthase glutaminase subunit PdxT [bacterium]